MAASVKRSLNYKWQSITDQRRIFDAKVDQYMNQLSEKLNVSDGDDVREQLYESAMKFFNQAMPDVEDGADAEKLKNDVGLVEQKIKDLEEEMIKQSFRIEKVDQIVENIHADGDQQLKKIKAELEELKSQRNEDAKKQEEDRKTLSELRDMILYYQGGASAMTRMYFPTTRRPKSATVVGSIGQNNVDDVVVLTSGLILVAYRKSSSSFLGLYNKAKLLKEYSFEKCNTYSLVVLEEPQVAVIDRDHETLQLMNVTETLISEQSSLELGKKYSAVGKFDNQTLAMVFGDPVSGVDILDLKGQVLRTVGTDHKISHICGTEDGSIICSGDGYISRYRVQSQTKTFSVKGKTVEIGKIVLKHILCDLANGLMTKYLAPEKWHICPPVTAL